MIDVKFFTISDDRKKINKNVDVDHPDFELSCEVKENESIIEPTIRATKNNFGKNFFRVNYAYISDFGRFYFIDSIIVETGGIISLNCSIDPLMTYSANLMNTAFEIARSEAVNSKYYIDNEKALTTRKVFTYQEFTGSTNGNIPQDLTGNKYTITVAGG